MWPEGTLFEYRTFEERVTLGLEAVDPYYQAWERDQDGLEELEQSV